MHGSKKVNSVPYDVTYVYDFNGNIITHDTKNLVQTLSIRNKNKETSIKSDYLDFINKFEEKEQDAIRHSNINRRIIGNENCASNKYYENIEQVQQLVGILNPERASAYDDWIRLGWCLKNIDNRLLECWDTFSQHSKKYEKGFCEKLWNKMRDNGLGIGSLHMWAKKDNPTAYAEIMKTDLKTLIYQSMSMTHNDIARVVYQMFQNEFVCSSIKNKVWYEFKKHRWHITDSGLGLRIRLSEEVWRTYNLEAIEYSQKGISSTNKADQDKYIEQAKKLSEISMKLRNSSFKENIMKECAELFYIEKFQEKLDSNTNLIGFENGVYDTETHEFRDGRPDDFITFSTGNNYIPYDHLSPAPIIKEINKYLEQVLTKHDIREYVLKLFATFITGQIKEQKFYIWTGTGSNSKSKLVELFEKSFGDYCCKFPITLLTQKRAASNAANSELARAKGKRFACLQEPSEDEKINIGLMKELSGGDKIMARALFQEPFEFFPQFKMLLLCNHLPVVPSDDGGTWRRIRVVEFTSKFVECPQEANEFPIDYDLSSKMEGWRDHFFGMLIYYLKKYQVEGITEPADVMKCTTEYKLKNDHMSSYISTHVEKKESSFLTLDEVFSDLREWIKSDNVPIKQSSKQDLEKYLNKALTPCVVVSGKKGYKGFRLTATCNFDPNISDDLEK
jgi:P4 family phage/plasmid primase-like protien